EEQTAELFQGLPARNGSPREAVRPQCLRKHLDTCPGGGGPIAEAKWFPRSCRAENGETKPRPGSVPARKSSLVLALRATPIPSVRGLRKTRRNGNNASLRIDLRESSRGAYAENMRLFLAGGILPELSPLWPANRKLWGGERTRPWPATRSGPGLV